MPVKSCQINNEPGYKWGDQGKCYAYTPGDEESKTAAKKQAIAQGVAIGDLEALATNINIVRGTYKFEEDYRLESYTDYPEAAKNAAKRALEWADKNGWGSCGTPVGKQRANQLANGEPISRETIARMAGFQRHQQNKDVPYSEGCGGLMWDAWGGTAGIEWAQRKLEEIDSEKLAGVKTSFDFDGVLTTRRGKELLNATGGDIYIITARSLGNMYQVYQVAKELRVPRSRVISTGSNQAKIDKVKELGIRTHWDNNPDVIKNLPGVGRLF